MMALAQASFSPQLQDFECPLKPGACHEHAKVVLCERKVTEQRRLECEQKGTQTTLCVSHRERMAHYACPTGNAWHTMRVPQGTHSTLCVSQRERIVYYALPKGNA
ncbi:hypothetical protein L6452_25291 [Arctium lappa]|uniref:Uncharacterized protein n=1 Tax=Arctium lappa TaxID=4217 RepID=A0ACB9AB60_ARCLA|nr:hypothetical protein L6452_25291 [Arctium lappa]